MKQWITKPLLLDFDGVLHGYPEGTPYGFQLNDPIVPGAAKFIKEAAKHFDVSVYSARSIDRVSRQTMALYLQKNGIKASELKWPIYKPPAWLTIDDRCICFDGKFPDMDKLIHFKSWVEK